jgi:hypothetical protein
VSSPLGLVSIVASMFQARCMLCAVFLSDVRTQMRIGALSHESERMRGKNMRVFKFKFLFVSNNSNSLIYIMLTLLKSEQSFSRYTASVAILRQWSVSPATE